MKNNKSWESIFSAYDILNHNFNVKPFKITADEIKNATRHFGKTSEKEVRILCKQDSRNERPKIFIDNDLFLLPVKNGEYIILKGDGYIDISPINDMEEIYVSKLDFELRSSQIGNSEMQYLDFAYASSLIRTFAEDNTLVLTIRGRKYTPEFNFNFKQYKDIHVQSVQTEVDAGFEGKEQIVLIEAKNSTTQNTIIRQLYYPFRQWKIHTQKEVKTLFFEKRGREYFMWEFGFADEFDYESIFLKKQKNLSYKIDNMPSC
ncbi:MAG: hypothetical protein LBP40_04125 [Campylobacteraceae bacterium]|nr:hypothetical protein [Campylobacteraceae bacterium]